MTVPYAFGAATSAIPLSQLDSNFNTPITLGNTAIQLGNTVTTLNNMTLANVTISSGNVTITNVSVTTVNASTVNTTTLVATTANVTTINATDVNVAANVTLNAGTANGVAYLNGSKVLTTGSALTFDGTNLGLSGTNPAFIGNSSSTAFYIDNRTVGKVITFRVSAAAQADTEAVTIASASGGIGAVGIGYTSLTSVGNNGLAVAGNVGIGTSSPVSKLQSVSAVSALTSNAGFSSLPITVSDSTALAADTGGGINFNAILTAGGVYNSIAAIKAGRSFATGFDYRGYLSFYTGSNATGYPVENMRLDSSGNLGIGASSPSGKLHVAGQTRIQDSANAANYILIGSGANAPRGGNAVMAQTSSMVMGTEGAAPLIFITNATEAARITSAGELLVGTQNASPGYGNTNTGVQLSAAGSTFSRSAADYVMAVNQNTSDGGNYYQIVFRQNNTGVGNITSTASSTAYNTSSDYRLKNNPQPLTGSGAFIDALKPKTWDWKVDGSKGVGFIAHEVQAVSPGSVVGTKDAVDEEGNPIMQAMEYGSAEFIANIVAELQSLRARVAQLESKGA